MFAWSNQLYRQADTFKPLFVFYLWRHKLTKIIIIRVVKEVIQMGYQSGEIRKLEKYSTDWYEVRISFILIAILSLPMALQVPITRFQSPKSTQLSDEFLEVIRNHLSWTVQVKYPVNSINPTGQLLTVNTLNNWKTENLKR